VESGVLNDWVTHHSTNKYLYGRYLQLQRQGRGPGALHAILFSAKIL